MLRPVGHGSQDSAAQREQTREMTLLTGEQSLFLCSSTHTKVPALVLYLWELPFLSLSNRFNPFASLSPKPSISGAWNQSGAAELLRHTLGTRWEPTWRQGGQVRQKSPQATASCTVWTKITPRTQRMLELHETQQWGRLSSPAGWYSPGEPCVHTESMAEPGSALLSPDSLSSVHSWGLRSSLFSAQCNCWRARRRPAHQEVKLGLPQAPQKTGRYATSEKYIYFFNWNPLAFFIYSPKFRTSNAFTSNRYWFLYNNSQNTFLGSTLSFSQYWQLVNIYTHVYKYIYIHICKQCNQDGSLQ